MDQFPPPPPPVPQLPEPLLTPELGVVPWRAREAVLVAIFALLTGAFFVIILTAVIRSHGALTNDQQNLLTLLATIVIEGALGMWVVLWVKLRHHVGLKALAFRARKSDVLAGIAAAVVGLVVASIVTAIVVSLTKSVTGHPVTQPKQLPPGLHGSAQIVIAGIAVILVAPFAEELFFRGFLYQALRKWRGPVQAMIISGAIFAISHGAPLLIVGIFPLGVILGYLFEHRGSLGATISAHMTYNLIGFIFLLTVQR